jgi:NADPH-dependent glutamate synthase beta subunit-like oxidoreductase
MKVYDRERVAPRPVPKGFADDTGDPHFVPAPCQVACPIGTDAPSYIAQIWAGEIEAAFESITATNPFSSVCGRVCDAPCEPACRRADSDGPLAIRNLKRYVMDKLGHDHHATPVPVSRSETVGIVGGGPAGMTAAQDLAEAGFAVTVYEMTDRLGGMMAWGVPDFRLPVGEIEADIRRIRMRCPGIEVKLNTRLGRDVTLDELKQRHDAVLLTIGAWGGKKMAMDGGADPRVIDGVEFLRRVNGGERPPMPEKVLVVGGGDVAMDACRVARRLPGCREVTVVYRRGPDEIPARRDELHGAIAEKIEIVYHTQPVGIVSGEGRFALRCVRTRLGEPDIDGRRRPETVPDSEHDVEGGLVIMAIGQQADCGELAELGLLKGDRVDTNWVGMRTADPQVFAAGDGAFGGSSIVEAMHHGHRAAYYVKSFLDGIEEPMAYRVPFRTRRVPIAQDADWEVIPRIEQPFHGLGADPSRFDEVESAYTDEEARAEAARCYRCDAETGSADYSVRTREDIFVMARTRPDDIRTQAAILRRRLAAYGDPGGEAQPAVLDDLVFLPANLSRLVIDPYRDACNVATEICGIRLETPFLVAGFDDAPEEIRNALAAALRSEGSAYLGRRDPGEGIPWIQMVDSEPDPAARAHVVKSVDGTRIDGIPRGLAVSASDLPAMIPAALDAGLDFLVLEGNGPLASEWPELAGPPDLTAVRDCIRDMRRRNREEDLEILWFGGIRTGTDGAKLIGLGANALVVGLAMAIAMGGRIEHGGVVFEGDRTEAERIDAATMYLRALSGEISIMARCTGKTNIHNVEPEDLRSITLRTAEATGIPLAGVNQRLAKQEASRDAAANAGESR